MDIKSSILSNKFNSKKPNLIRLVLLTLLLNFAFIPTKALAQDAYKIFASRQYIAIDKCWNIKFSDNIDPVTVNKNNIKIVDQDGNSIELNISCSGNSISIKPVKDYDGGKNYTLYITNVMSIEGYNLKSPSKMNFTTIKDVQADQNTDYSLIDTHAYKIRDILTVTAKQSTNFNLTFNIGTPSNSPYQKELALKVSGPNAQVSKQDSTHEKLIANSSIKPGQKIYYQVVRDVLDSGIKYKSDLSKTSGDYSKFKDYTKYITSSERIESDNQAIKNKAKELLSGINNPYYKAKKAYEFVNTYMTYDDINGNKGALNALNTGKGNCEDYSELFVALMRASGVPARVVTGFWMGNTKAGLSVDGDPFRHGWPEYYLPEYGWIVVEPTNAYYVGGKRVVDYSYFSNLDQPGHIMEGYDAAGNDKDADSYYSYAEGSELSVVRQTIVEVLN